MLAVMSELQLENIIETIDHSELTRARSLIDRRLQTPPGALEDIEARERLYQFCMTIYGRVLLRELQKKPETLATKMAEGRTYQEFLEGEIKETIPVVGSISPGPSIFEMLFRKIVGEERFEDVTAKNYLIAMRSRFESLKYSRNFDSDPYLRKSLEHLNRVSGDVTFMDFNLRENRLRTELIALIKRFSGNDLLFYKWARNLLEKQSLAYVNLLHEIVIGKLRNTLAEEKLLKEELLVRQRQMDQELRMAQRIQMSLLPTEFPEHTGLKFYSVYMPVSTVGGDFYDVAFSGHKENNWAALFLADVSGHGMPAAFIAAMAKVGWKHGIEGIPCPSDVMKKLNNELYEAINGNFLTAYLGVFKHDSSLTTEERGSFHFAAAGHHPAVLLRKGSPLNNLHARGQLIGIFPEINVQEKSIPFFAGDRFIFFTDGFPETRSRAGHFLGMDPFVNILEQGAHLEGSEFCEFVVSRIFDFAGGAAQEDDLTLVVVDVK